MIASMPRFIAIVAVLILIFGVHLTITYLIRRRTPFPLNLIPLALLTCLSTILWVVAALAIFYSCVDCHYEADAKPIEEILFNSTLELPLTSDGICAVFPSLLYFGRTTCGVLNLLLLPLSLYLLGIIVFFLVPAGEQGGR